VKCHKQKSKEEQKLKYPTTIADMAKKDKTKALRSMEELIEICK
jgi:hypothetical protein